MASPTTTLTFLALIALFLTTTFGYKLDNSAVARDVDGPEASPEAKTPFPCRNPDGRAARFGKCVCYLIFSNKIRTSMIRLAKTTCIEMFGNKKTNRRNRRFCKPFRRPTNKVNIRLVFRKTQKFINLCQPDSKLVLMLRMSIDGMK